MTARIKRIICIISKLILAFSNSCYRELSLSNKLQAKTFLYCLGQGKLHSFLASDCFNVAFHKA